MTVRHELLFSRIDYFKKIFGFQILRNHSNSPKYAKTAHPKIILRKVILNKQGVIGKLIG